MSLSIEILEVKILVPNPTIFGRFIVGLSHFLELGQFIVLCCHRGCCCALFTGYSNIWS